MPIRESGPPARHLYRVGRANPLQWAAWRYVGASRFDDPGGQFRVLYAGERRACFIESLADFRPGLAAAEWSGSVPTEWFATRQIARFSILDPDWRAVDLRVGETMHALRSELRAFLADRGYGDFDMSDVLGQDVHLTQAIAAWAYERGYRGIIYASRLALELTCVAIFEPTLFTDVQISDIEVSDPDLQWTAGVLNLSLPD